MSANESVTSVFVDLAATSAESDRWREAREARSAKFFLTSFGSTDDWVLNVNDMLVDDDFWSEQMTHADEVDLAFQQHFPGRSGSDLACQASKVLLWDHNLLEVQKWLATLQRLLDRHGALDLCVPEAPTAADVYLIEAEGETSNSAVSRLFYARTDFLLGCIRSWAENRANVHLRQYKLSKPRNFMKTRRLARAIGAFAASALGHVVGLTRHRLRYGRSGMAQSRLESCPIIAISRSSVHTDYLAPLASTGNVGFVVADSYRTYPRNLANGKLLLGHAPSSHLYDLLTFFDLIGTVLASAFTLVRTFFDSTDPHVMLYGSRILLKQFRREAVAISIDGLLVSRAVRKLVSGHAPKIILHCEMFTLHATYLACTLCPSGHAVYQVAFGTYKMRPTPRFVEGNGMLCFSQDQQRSMRAVRGSQEPIHYFGNFHLGESTKGDRAVRKDSGDRPMVAFYTQPYKRDVEFRVIDHLLATCDRFGLALTLVLHPRDVRSSFQSYADRCAIIMNDDYLRDRRQIEAKFSLAVTRTSNVGYYLILRNLPVLNVLADPGDLLVEQEYFDGYPLVGNSLSIIDTVLGDLDGHLQRFDAFRNAFIERSYAGKGVRQAVEALTAQGMQGMRP